MDCIICLGELENPSTLPCCSKTFCGDCLSNWVNIRNCCPLCITPIGTTYKNQLSNICSEEFDNGCLMLESQMGDVIQRYTHLQELLHIKKEASYNHKNVFPKYRLEHAEREMDNIEQNIEIASIALTENDRVTATNSIQAMTELIYSVQAILDGHSEVEHMEYSSDEEYEDNYHQEERLYEMAEFQQKKNNLRGSKRKI